MEHYQFTKELLAMRPNSVKFISVKAWNKLMGNSWKQPKEFVYKTSRTNQFKDKFNGRIYATKRIQDTYCIIRYK